MSNKKSDRASSIPGYIYALDGVRAVSIMLIFIFHSWQQSWISYQIRLPNGKFLINLDIFQRYGYIAIDSLFVLSGFCLFYPVARAMFGETNPITWKTFYKKRIMRIVPGYWLMLIILLFVPALSYTTYDIHSASDLFKHFGSHAVFLHGLSSKTIGSTISTAWTLPIEVGFYLIFPLIAVVFKKKPVPVFLGLFVISQCFRLYCAFYLGTGSEIQAIPLGYLDVFGVGMLSAYFVVYARNKLDMGRLKWFMTALSVVCLFGIYYFMKWLSLFQIPGADGSVYFRWFFREILCVIIALFLFSATFSIDLWNRKILGNRFFVFISAISYSFYLWHQNINIFLKKINVPYTTVSPVMNDRAAMDGYVILTIVISLAIAVASTYLIEMPIARRGVVGYFKNIINGAKAAPQKIKEALKNA